MVSDRVRCAVVPSGAVATIFTEALSLRPRRSSARPFLFSFFQNDLSFGPGVVEDTAGVVEDLARIDAAPDQLGAGGVDRRPHFLRDCLGHARKDQHNLLGALIRPIFNADSQAQARDRLSEAIAHLEAA